MATLKHGLTLQKRSAVAAKPSISKPARLFGDDDSEPENEPKENAAKEIGVFDIDNPPKPSDRQASNLKSSKQNSSKPSPPILQSSDLSTRQTHRKQIEEATSIDPSIYDYDAAFDAIHAKDAAKKAAKREEAERREAKYIAQAMASAEVRKRDQLRAKDKMLQKEREAEGDEFTDKAKFVTEAYKKQQEDLRRLEEEEAIKEKHEAKKKQGTGQFLYNSLMSVEDKRHQEATAAAELIAKSGSKMPVEEPQGKTQQQIAQELNAQGGNIVINEDGEVAIKTQLLSAGLNMVPKPKSARSAAAGAARASAPQQVYQGRTATQKGVRERQSRLVEQQLEQAVKRAAEEEDEEQKKIERAAKSRKTEGEISSARERYLQRKKEAAAAAAKKS